MNVTLARLLAGSAIAIFAAGCAGSNSSPLPNAPIPSAFRAALPATHGTRLAVKLRLVVPRKRRVARYGRPQYISPATQGITIALTGPSFNSSVVAGLTPSSPGCVTGTSGVTCTLSLGALAPCVTTNCYAATLTTYDAVACGGGTCTIPNSAKELSAAQSVPFNVAIGTANIVSATLGGIPRSIAVSPLRAGYLRGDAHQLRLWGANGQSLVAVGLDADNNPIVGPGAPAISVSSGSKTMTASGPVAGSPNVVRLQATTGGIPSVVTPGIAELTVTATPQSGSGGSPVSINVPVTIAHSAVYIGEYGAIAVYYDGNTLTPNATITGSNTGLNAVDAADLAVDSHGELYASIAGDNEILEFPAGSNYNATPNVLTGANTLLTTPIGIAADSAGTLYVANTGSSAVTEYGALTTGNVAPSTTISGSSTLLSSPIGLTLDASGAIYSISSGTNTISVFAAGSSGNVLTRSISGSATTLNAEGYLAVLPDGTLCALGDAGLDILEFAPGAGGNVAPVAKIAGSNTGLNAVSGIAADAAGTLYAVNDKTITEYVAGANGNVTPTATIDTSPAYTYSVAVVPAATTP